MAIVIAVLSAPLERFALQVVSRSLAPVALERSASERCAIESFLLSKLFGKVVSKRFAPKRALLCIFVHTTRYPVPGQS